MVHSVWHVGWLHLEGILEIRVDRLPIPLSLPAARDGYAFPARRPTEGISLDRRCFRRRAPKVEPPSRARRRQHPQVPRVLPATCGNVGLGSRVDFRSSLGQMLGAASSSYTVRNSFVGWSEWLSIRGLALGGCNSREKSTFYVYREPLLLAVQCQERGMSRKLVDACRGRFRTSRHISTYIPTHPHRHAMHTFALSLSLSSSQTPLCLIETKTPREQTLSIAPNTRRVFSREEDLMSICARLAWTKWSNKTSKVGSHL